MFVAKQVAYPVRKSNVTFAPTAVANCSIFRNYFANNFVMLAYSIANEHHQSKSQGMLY